MHQKYYINDVKRQEGLPAIVKANLHKRFLLKTALTIIIVPWFSGLSGMTPIIMLYGVHAASLSSELTGEQC